MRHWCTCVYVCLCGIWNGIADVSYSLPPTSTCILRLGSSSFPIIIITDRPSYVVVGWGWLSFPSRCCSPTSATNYHTESCLQNPREFSTVVWMLIFSAVLFPTFRMGREVIIVGHWNRFCLPQLNVCWPGIVIFVRCNALMLSVCRPWRTICRWSAATSQEQASPVEDSGPRRGWWCSSTALRCCPVGWWWWQKDQEAEESAGWSRC